MVFAKYPEPGKVKTRLTKMTTAEESAEFFEACLLDSLDRYLALDETDVLLFMAGEDKHDFVSKIPDGISILTQEGEGLGARMSKAFDDAFNLLYKRVCIIGTDHPTLPADYLSLAFKHLEREQAVIIGPSEDGGYYLLGMNRPIPRLFEDMTYSHSEVYKETVSRIREDSVRALEALPYWYDVDEPNDLKRLSNDLKSSKLALPRVRKVVKKLSIKYVSHRLFS